MSTRRLSRRPVSLPSAFPKPDKHEPSLGVQHLSTFHPLDQPRIPEAYNAGPSRLSSPITPQIRYRSRSPLFNQPLPLLERCPSMFKEPSTLEDEISFLRDTISILGESFASQAASLQIQVTNLGARITDIESRFSEPEENRTWWREFVGKAEDALTDEDYPERVLADLEWVRIVEQGMERIADVEKRMEDWEVHMTELSLAVGEENERREIWTVRNGE